MKHVKYILLSSVILLLSAGCTKEELPELATDTPGITINLRMAGPLSVEEADANTALLRSLTGKTNGQITTRAASLTPLDGEKLITNAYVLFYAKSATATTPPAIFEAATNLNSSDGHSFVFDHSRLTLLNPGTEYDIYVLANLPASTTAPSQSTTKGELLELNEKQFVRNANNPEISFFGTGSFTYDRGNEKTINIDILRTVARLDIQITGLIVQTGQTVSVQVTDQAATVPYFNPTRTVPASDPYFTSTVMENSGIYRIYVYPNYTSGNDLRNASLNITVTNSDGSLARMCKPVVINSGTIEQNKIYEITCAF